MTRKILVMSLVVWLLAACSGAPAPAAPAAPTAAPAAPTVAPAVPTEVPAAPTEAPAVPTEAPAAPTAAALPPTQAPTETAAPSPTVAATATVAVTPTVAVAMTPTAALATTPTASGVVTSTSPEEGGIPMIPHPLAGRDNCLACHITGGAAEPLPADHAGRAMTSCQGCHKPAPAQGEATPGAAVGDAVVGAKLFQTAGCAGCHSVEPDKKLVGPSLAGIASDAADSVKEPEYKGKAKDAAGWLLESIVDPNADVPEGFAPNVMPQDFGKKLSQQDLNNLVAYLLTLK